MSGYRIVVADTTRAKLFMLEKPGEPLRHLGSLTNPYTGKHDRDIGADAPGRVMTRAGNGARRTALQPRRSHKQHATEQFARLLAERIKQDAKVDPHDLFMLVIAPRFLAEVREQLPATLQRRIVREVKRDLVDIPRGELRARVTSALRPGFNRRGSSLP